MFKWRLVELKRGDIRYLRAGSTNTLVCTEVETREGGGGEREGKRVAADGFHAVTDVPFVSHFVFVAYLLISE